MPSSYNNTIILNPNRYPMRDWHVKNMQNTIVKYLTGLPENPTRYQRMLHKRYGGLDKVCNRIRYDLKHGVKNEEIFSFFDKVKTDSDFSDLRKINGYSFRLNEIEGRFTGIT
ncbi:MAG: hypothetical protein ACM31J_06490 [Nitrososphaerales archaeon]